MRLRFSRVMRSRAAAKNASLFSIDVLRCGAAVSGDVVRLPAYGAAWFVDALDAGVQPPVGLAGVAS